MRPWMQTEELELKHFHGLDAFANSVYSIPVASQNSTDDICDADKSAFLCLCTE